MTRSHWAGLASSSEVQEALVTRSSADTPSATLKANRLFFQDRLIAWNTIRATFARWQDRVIAALLLIAVLGVVRAWFADRPWLIAAWATLAVGTMIGFWTGRLIMARLTFHAFDGLLAADALHPSMRRRYVVTWHGVGWVVLAVVTLVARPSLLVISIPAYSVGAMIAGLASRLKMPKPIVDIRRPGWTIRKVLGRPSAGVSAAMVLLLTLLPARSLGMSALMAIVGIETVLLVLILTSVDETIVRFMTIAGHEARRIVIYHAGAAIAFLAVAVAGCWIILGPIAVGVIVATGAVTLLLVTLRILAYRLHAKRFADLLVFILASLLILLAYAMPVAFPIVALAILRHMQRRGRAKKWLLA